MLHRESVSPSPPPEAPTATTPGLRAARLQKVFSGALSSSIKSNSYANFSACFPTPAKYCPTALEGVWRQLNARLEEECTRDFEKILDERSVVDGLNQWDALIEDARRRKDRSTGEGPGRPMHTLTGEELHEAHLTPFLAQANTELERRLKETREENRSRMETVEAQRKEIETLMSGLEGVVRDIEGSVEAMTAAQGSGVQDLSQDVWMMDQEVEATR